MAERRIPPLPETNVEEFQNGGMTRTWRVFWAKFLRGIELIAATPGTVADLPPAAARLGTRGFVTDATLSLAAGHGQIVIGGGANSVPVYSDETNWRIG